MPFRIPSRGERILTGTPPTSIVPASARSAPRTRASSVPPAGTHESRRSQGSRRRRPRVRYLRSPRRGRVPSFEALGSPRGPQKPVAAPLHARSVSEPLRPSNTWRRRRRRGGSVHKCRHRLLWTPRRSQGFERQGLGRAGAIEGIELEVYDGEILGIAGTRGFRPAEPNSRVCWREPTEPMPGRSRSEACRSGSVPRGTGFGKALPCSPRIVGIRVSSSEWGSGRTRRLRFPCPRTRTLFGFSHARVNGRRHAGSSTRFRSRRQAPSSAWRRSAGATSRRSFSRSGWRTRRTS